MTGADDWVSEKNVPDNARLLRGIQATLRKLKKNVSDEQSLMELNTIDVVLSEMASRDQRVFYADLYVSFRALLLEGVKRLPTNPEANTIRQELADSLPPQLDPALNYDLIAAKIHRVKRHLSWLVRVSSNGDAAIQDFMARVCTLENDYLLQRVNFHDQRTLAEPDAAAPLSAEKMTEYLQQKFPERAGLRVTKFKQLVGGFQKITVFFETEDASGKTESLVLRSEKNDKFAAMDAGDICKEFEIVKHVFDAGCMVAEPMWLEPDASKLGQRFLVSRRAPGANYGSAIGNDDVSPMTDDVVRSFISTIAKVHKLPVNAEMRKLSIGHWADYRSAQENYLAMILLWRNQPWMKGGNPSPIADRLTRWLTDNMPSEDINTCLVHCDYGLHNVLVKDMKVSGIVDWESCRIGDPAEDLAWILHGNFPGITFEKIAAWYEEFTGNRISEYRLRYYNVMLCLKFLMSGTSAESMYEKNEEASIVWLILSYRYTTYATTSFESLINLAESARAR